MNIKKFKTNLMIVMYLMLAVALFFLYAKLVSDKVEKYKLKGTIETAPVTIDGTHKE